MHQKLGFADKVVTDYTAIQGDLPPEHAQFYETCLPFIPVTTLDESGRPWGSILAGKNGEKGFVHSRRYTQLDVVAQLWNGDPLEENLQQFDGKDVLIAGIGVEFPTRRRNKFAGVVSKLQRVGHDIEMELTVNEAIGNCPKYINIRDLQPQMDRLPKIVYKRPSLSIEDRLPEDVIRFILSSDTVFLGTSYVAKPEDASRFPSHVGMNHRGGLAGFVRVRKDGRTVVLPDYSGNRLMTSLGNIECTPLASLTFVNFTTGDILYLTGEATNLVGTDAHNLMPFQNALTTIHTTGFVLVNDALPVRQKAETEKRSSPYSPPVRLLAEEAAMNLFQGDERPEALLTQIKLHEAHIATFTWESSTDLPITPGQAIILDCASFLGTRQYQHMSPINPTSVNDDKIRTWTVSSSSTGPTRSFSITIRYKPGGALTTALFSIAQKLQQFRVELLDDARPLQLAVKIAGVTGDFILPLSPPPQPRRDLVWFAGGIGLTPFLSMLSSLRETVKDEQVNIRFILSTREPATLLRLIFQAYYGVDPQLALPARTPNPNIHLDIDVFYSKYEPSNSIQIPSDNIRLRQNEGRLDAAFISKHKADVVGKDIYVCGPEDYTQTVIGALTGLGVEPDRIRTEGFFY
ncbi:hypothetical protein P691DRAFT_812715 [Macrolepiota fuliginosa MF-IS2]|uniref:FAD-binding FR-type domain-containing protein n=1 Tax=Macrolepiota fuliginosa MF-IS2 TaxID=1400762 RepID=A0A9P5X234_9AGAR|nr:hypothetical protein P691DRAFT_812715 [Macrolepiota fuliginosa MF-IS2]